MTKILNRIAFLTFFFHIEDFALAKKHYFDMTYRLLVITTHLKLATRRKSRLFLTTAHRRKRVTRTSASRLLTTFAAYYEFPTVRRLARAEKF